MTSDTSVLPIMVRKRCRHCGKYNEYPVRYIQINREDALEFIGAAIGALEKLRNVVMRK